MVSGTLSPTLKAAITVSKDRGMELIDLYIWLTSNFNNIIGPPMAYYSDDTVPTGRTYYSTVMFGCQSYLPCDKRLVKKMYAQLADLEAMTDESKRTIMWRFNPPFELSTEWRGLRRYRRIRTRMGVRGMTEDQLRTLILVKHESMVCRSGIGIEELA